MWFLMLLLTFSFLPKGEMSLCNTPVPFVCKTPNPSPDYFVPGNKAELKTYCSTTMDFLECLHSYDVACKGRSRFSALSPPMYYHRIKHVLDKICDEKSSKYDTLVRNLPCIKQRVTAMDEICGRSNSKTQKAYNEYLLQHPEKKVKAGFPRNLRNQCLSFVTTTACLIDNIEQECGFSAYEVTSEVMLETQILGEKCDIDIFLELKEAVSDFNLDSEIKEGLEEYFVVEIEK